MYYNEGSCDSCIFRLEHRWASEKRLMGVAFVMTEMSGKSASLNKSAHCINKQFCAQEVMKSSRANFSELVYMSI